MGDSKDSTDLTPRMAEILELMLYGFDEGLTDPTGAVAEVLGESRATIAAVTRHLVRRGWMEKTELGYVATARAQDWAGQTGREG